VDFTDPMTHRPPASPHSSRRLSNSIASPTGEGMTTALSFTRERRCTMKDAFRFV
jgi:hypothetical protein